MSGLSEKLKASAAIKKENNLIKWLKGLDEVDRKAVWGALRDEETWKTYTLLNFLRDEGGTFDKGIFVPFRKGVLDGTITEEDVHGSE